MGKLICTVLRGLGSRNAPWLPDQTVETKAIFIEQMKRGDVSVREMDDIGDAVLSASEIKAIASGNPLVMAKVKLDMEVQKLEAAQSGDRDSRVRMRRTIANNELERQRIQGRIPFLAAAKAQADATAEDEFKAAILDGAMVSDATAYTKRDAAGEALIKVIRELDALTQSTREHQERTVGRYRGFELKVSTSTYGEPALTIMYTYENYALLVGQASPKSFTGVFQSIAYVINHIGDEIDRVDARLIELNESDVSCDKLLDEPWPQEAHLTELRERRDRINAELSAAGDTAKKQQPAAPTDDTTSATAETPPADGFVVMAESDADHIDTAPIAPTPTWTPWEIERPAVMIPTPEDREAMVAAIRVLRGVEAAPAPIEERVEEPSAEPIEVATVEVVAPTPAEVLDMPPATLEIPARPAKVPALVFGARVPTPTTKKAKPAPTHTVRTVRMADVQQMDLFGGDIAHAAIPHTDSGPAQISMF